MADGRAKERQLELGWLFGPCPPGVEKSALGPLRPLLELLAPLMEQAQAAQSSRSKGSGGLSNLQIFGTGKRAAARDPSRSP